MNGVEYEGEGDPDVLITSDFPLQGSSRTQRIQIVEAIRFILEEQNWKAGDHNVAYQSCDDATAQAAKWDSASAPRTRKRTPATRTSSASLARSTPAVPRS